MSYCMKKCAVPDYVTQLEIYDEETGKRVATVFDADAARLFAAAPKMLEALRVFGSAVWDDIRLPGDFRNDLKCFYHTLVVQAIREATTDMTI